MTSQYIQHGGIVVAPPPQDQATRRRVGTQPRQYSTAVPAPPVAATSSLCGVVYSPPCMRPTPSPSSLSPSPFPPALPPQEALDSARRQRRVSSSLYVAVDNGPARQLYAAMGYRTDAELPDYYRPGAHALRLVADL